MQGLMFVPEVTLALLMNVTLARSEAPKKDEPLTDEQFVIRALECNHSEVQRADMAQKRSDRAEVRKFAQQMSQEHDQCRKELLKHAGDLKVAVVSGLSKEHKECIDRLSKADGKEFDREYLKSVIDNHERIIKLFQSEAKNGAIEGLRSHAKKMIPVFQEHLKHAKTLKEKAAQS